MDQLSIREAFNLNLRVGISKIVSTYESMATPKLSNKLSNYFTAF
jgi:hypothetical protein